MPRTPVDTVVIGGGLAGLTAASTLLASGQSILLLEARSSIGGKVQNRALNNGSVTEVGAEFIGPTQDAVLAMVKELELELFDVFDKGKYTLWRRGKKTVYSPKLWLDSLPPVSWMAVLQLGVAQLRLDSLAAQIDVKAPWNHPKAKEWDAVSFDEWLKRWAWLADARFMLDIASRAVWGAEPREMSLLYVLSYIAGAGNEAKRGTLDRLLAVQNGAQESRVVGGTGLICKRLLRKIGAENLVVGAAVQKVVSIDSEGYEIRWGEESVQAKRVIIAIAPPLIERIEFEPALPEPRRMLNKGMTMGQMGKAIAVYDSPWWRDEGLNAQIFSDEGVIGLTFDNSPEDGSFGAILSFFQGDVMREVDKMPIDEIKQKVLGELVRYLGPKAAGITDFTVQRWGLEEHLWGGPTAVAPKNIFSQYGSALRKPVGGIHFAGTETSEYWPGYMDGAIRSGKRAAQEIVDSLK